MEILRRSAIPVEGQNAVVVGRSDIVGKPVAMLLTNANATVTIAIRRRATCPAFAAPRISWSPQSGGRGMITRDYVKPGATVLDVGINRIDQATSSRSFMPGTQKRETGFRAEGLHANRRRASECGGSCRRINAGAGRRRQAHHRHADVEHGESGKDAPRRCVAPSGMTLEMTSKDPFSY